jgi:membrane protein implicated in regulation of membrane protease activity
VFVLVALVLLLVLSTPWNVVGFIAGLVAFGGEVAFWNRKVRGRRAAAGAETLIGKKGTAVSECRPHGQVRVDGEIWDARCDEGADRADAVVVTGREGLTLLVTRAGTGPYTRES